MKKGRLPEETALCALAAIYSSAPYAGITRIRFNGYNLRLTSHPRKRFGPIAKYGKRPTLSTAALHSPAGSWPASRSAATARSLSEKRNTITAVPGVWLAAVYV